MNYVFKLSHLKSGFKATSMSFLITFSLSFMSFGAFSNEQVHADEFVTLSAEMARANGIQTMTVTSGQLQTLATVYGDVVTDPASLSHIRARFDGVISAVKVNLGDKVKLGDTLATVESNESLKSYKISSPFTGSVIARHANAGELSNGQILFSIANYDDVWVKLKMFPKQLQSIKAGQKVSLSHSGLKQNAVISHIAPSPETKPYSFAFIRVSNKDGQWPIGALVKGQITTAMNNAALLIPKAALQEFEGKTVVFTQEGNSYYPRPIMLGAADNINIEVLSGVKNGEHIVSHNSYLIKADLEKSQAGHDH